MAKPVAQPNMIVFFVESLSARIVEPYSTLYPGLTPGIQSMARQGSVFRHHYNHAFPTVNGLRGQLCSVFPIFANEAFRSRKAFQGPASFGRCLPRILAENGYDTAYFSYAHPQETFFDEQMRAVGFGERAFYRDLLARFYDDEPAGPCPLWQ